MKIVKCDRCKEEISPDTRLTMRNIYNISYMGVYMDLCDKCYYKLVRFINNTDRLSKIESVINNWVLATDDNDEHELLERIADIIRGGSNDETDRND